ncbi:hypothetical protein DL767_003174 [Monosporascus sp. MG133]|nr:hypothetical protein DL767_003174 [Monosporascus sp. MG133]
MSWRQVSLGHWQRPLGENERMIKWIGDRAHPIGREQWSITASGRFNLLGQLKTSDTTARLQRAWVHLRFSHPSIAATASDNTLDYHVPDFAALTQWIEDTFHVIADPGITASDLVADLKPSPYVTVYFLPREQQVVLHTSHWRTDGFGALQLLNAFFEAVASDVDPKSVPWKEEPARLSPSIEEVLKIPTEPTQEIKAATADCLATVARAVGSVGLPYRGDHTTKPGGTRSVRRRFPVSTTRGILQACDARGLRLLSAVHASLAKINFKFAGGSDLESMHSGYYTSTMRFSLRPYLSAPFNTAQHASALYTGGYFASVDARSSWQEMAAQYESLYSSGLGRGFLLARRQYAIEALAAMMRNAGAAPVRSEIDISSVGDAEELVTPIHHISKEQGGAVSELEIQDISLGVECLTRETYLFLWTFKGKIEFQLMYNEAFYEAKFMEMVLDALAANLIEQLYSEDSTPERTSDTN